MPSSTRRPRFVFPWHGVPARLWVALLALALPACGRSLLAEQRGSSTSTSTSTTTSSTSTTSTSTTTSSGTGGTGGAPGFCGDGIVDEEEECDDGNSANADGCFACEVDVGWVCQGEPSKCGTVCGDGLVVGFEQCDDGDNVSGDGCSADCQVETTELCGNGVVETFEACDDGNLASGDGCSAGCFVEPGYTCFDQPSICVTTCGDGIVAGAETCEDFNAFGGDGCSPGCQVEPGWTCVLTIPAQCQPVCGDGLVVGFEQCDDANTKDGDGCSSACTVEVGLLCGDGVKAGAEQCDDGNVFGGDCCSADCQIEAGCEIESNDTIATANAFASVAIGNQVKGLITPGTDLDVFSVVIPPGAKGSITAATLDGFLGTPCVPNQLDSFITIYDANGNTLGTDDDSGPGFCALLTVNGLDGGTYYVEVRKTAFGGPQGTFDYTLRIDLQLSVCGNGTKEASETCDDGNLVDGDGCSSKCLVESGLTEIEPNDTFAQADANAVANPGLNFTGDTLVSGAIATNGDNDTYKLTLATPTVVRFETFDLSISDCTPATRTRLTVFNASLLPVASDTNSGISTCSALVLPLAAGTYYVQVAGAQPNTLVAGYYLEIKTQADAGAEVEPNDTIATATPHPGHDGWMSADHSVGAEADFYAVTVPAGASIRAELIEGLGIPETCEGNSIDSRLTLFNAATAQLADDDDSGRGFCSMIDGTGSAPLHPGASALGGGTYYLRVSASQFAQNNPTGQFVYRLQVTVR